MKTNLKNTMYGLLLASPLPAHAQHSMSSTQLREAGSTLAAVKSNAANPPIVMGSTFQGRLWLARVEKQQLFVTYSESSGANFSVPVQVAPAPETIVAEGLRVPPVSGSDK